jgi:hypothetical protein
MAQGRRRNGGVARQFPQPHFPSEPKTDTKPQLVKKFLQPTCSECIFSLRGVITHMRQVITPLFFFVPEATHTYYIIFNGKKMYVKHVLRTFKWRKNVCKARTTYFLIVEKCM